MCLLRCLVNGIGIGIVDLTHTGVPGSGQFIALLTDTLVGSLPIPTHTVTTDVPEKGTFINI